MAFTPDIFNVVVQPFGGDGIRFVNYQTDDAADVVTTAGYFVGVESFGARVNDLVFVSPRDGDEEPYILTIVDIDVLGNGTAALSRSDLSMQRFDTVEELEDTRINRRVESIYVAGYYAPGDGGGAHYKRVALQPSHAGKIQSRDGAWWEISEQDIRVEMFGGFPSAPNISTIFQAAIDYLSGRGTPYNGGRVLLGSSIYKATGLVLKSRVYLVGQGPGATVIEAPDGTNQNILTVALGTSMAGWEGITFDGNADANLTAGHGIYFEPTGNNQGQSFSPFQGKPSQAEYSYKMISAKNFIVGYCRGNGVTINGYCFDVRLTDFRTSHNLGHGIQSNCTDCFVGTFYTERNGLCGLYAPLSGANKYVSGKAIFNGRQANTIGDVAGVLVMGQSNQLYCIEAQDNYCDGFYLGGVDSVFMLDANKNGYSAFGEEATSSRIHANYRFDASLRRAIFKGSSFDYASTPGTGGFWTTEYPYYIIAGADFSSFECKYEPGVFNSPPNTAQALLTNDALLEMRAFSVDGLATFFDMSPKAATAGQNTTSRMWRATQATGTHVLNFYVPGTAAIRHAIGGNGRTTFNADNVGNLGAGDVSTGGRWNTGHLELGPFHLWVDATGDLRIKGSAPTSDTDGTVVGTQT